jgi:hypothetical protein
MKNLTLAEKHHKVFVVMKKKKDNKHHVADKRKN